MSVLELTLSYTRLVTQGDFEAPALAFQQKKKLAIFGVCALVVSAGFYLFMMGEVVSKNYERNQRTKDLRQASADTQAVERRALGSNSLYTAEYFTQRGYEKPKELGIIKRAPNVAEAETSYLY